MSMTGVATRRMFLARLGCVAVGSAAARLAAKEGPGAVRPASPGTLPIDGKVIPRGAADYESIRVGAVWQAIKPPHFPSLIVQARSEADIVEALRYARTRSLPVGILGTGHSYVGASLRDDGVLLDVSVLREVQIDPEARTARVQPGIRALELSTRLAEYNLAFPVAHNPTVGLGGYLLGGGMGWNAEQWGGLACFNVRAVDVVTAAGERFTAGADSHSDLFWAARGAGPAFCAVVTRFHLDVFPRPQAIASGTYVYGIEEADNVIAWLERYRVRQPAELELVLIFANARKSGVDGGNDRQCIVSAVCFSDDSAGARRILEALADGAPKQRLVSVEGYRPTTMEELLAEDLASQPIRHCVETFWTKDSVEPLRSISRHFMNAPSEHTLVFANYRADPRLSGDGAYSVIAPLFVYSAAAWARPEDDAVNLSWSDKLVAELEPHTVGGYINEVEFTRHPGRARRCFSDASWERLRAVQARYDPSGMFTPPFMRFPSAMQ